MPEGFWLNDTQWERLAALLPLTCERTKTLRIKNTVYEVRSWSRPCPN